MYVGTLSFDLLLGDVRSLKEKRSLVRPIVAELQRKYAVSAAADCTRQFSVAGPEPNANKPNAASRWVTFASRIVAQALS